MDQELIFKVQIALFEFENEKNQNRPLPISSLGNPVLYGT